MEQQHAIRYLALSQEELIDAGAFDLQMSIAALEKGLLDLKKEKFFSPIRSSRSSIRRRRTASTASRRRFWRKASAA